MVPSKSVGVTSETNHGKSFGLDRDQCFPKYHGFYLLENDLGKVGGTGHQKVRKDEISEQLSGMLLLASAVATGRDEYLKAG